MIPALSSHIPAAARTHSQHPCTCQQQAIAGIKPARRIMAAASSNGANGAPSAPEEGRRLAVATQLVHASTRCEENAGGGQ
eukprot:1160924-Pelagomonas_calceolata.AAC.7